ATSSDAHTVSVAKSTDHGQTWSAPQVVSSGGATTAVFPAIAARNRVVDLSYYGSSASSIKDSTAVWNVFLARSTNAGASYSQTKVSDTPHHMGVICV